MNSRQIKGKVVDDYLAGKHKNLATLTLSRKIYNENPELFSSLESVRSMVRYRRGQDGKAKRATVKLTEQPTPGGYASKLGIPNPFHIPDSDEDLWEPYVLPKKIKALVLSDIHLPYHNVNALTLAFEKGQKEGVDCVILNGDTLDFHGISRYEKDPRKRSFGEELEIGREFLAALKKAFNMPIYYKIGNHEERWESYLRIKAPEILDVQDFQIDVLLRFGQHGVQLVHDKRVIKAGNLNIMHGHEFGRSVFSPVNPARGYYLKSKTNTLCGHNHQSSQHNESDLNGKITSVWSTGCLCELHPQYMPINKWNHGFAIVETWDDGSFEVDNYSIIKGRIR
jgi:predicted phosphodiesterase